mmetsp:Transcript_120370/g.256968  ORF Transcript_120370/g.256968 Transcript_120370/m.256968 type:complete len:214 (+) Transcript_120370:2222-2863(+)
MIQTTTMIIRTDVVKLSIRPVVWLIKGIVISADCASSRKELLKSVPSTICEKQYREQAQSTNEIPIAIATCVMVLPCATRSKAKTTSTAAFKKSSHGNMMNQCRENSAGPPRGTSVGPVNTTFLSVFSDLNISTPYVASILSCTACVFGLVTGVAQHFGPALTMNWASMSVLVSGAVLSSLKPSSPAPKTFSMVSLRASSTALRMASSCESVL